MVITGTPSRSTSGIRDLNWLRDTPPPIKITGRSLFASKSVSFSSDFSSILPFWKSVLISATTSPSTIPAGAPCASRHTSKNTGPFRPVDPLFTNLKKSAFAIGRSILLTDFATALAIATPSTS